MFFKAWNAYGRPVMSVVGPTETWSLPTGFAYDKTVDRIANVEHVILPNPEDYWTFDTVYIVPEANPKEVRNMIAVGAVPVGTVGVGVLESDAAKVRGAHAIQLKGEWYDVSSVSEGLNAGWRLVLLTRRS
jgi:hypothetical protein